MNRKVFKFALILLLISSFSLGGCSLSGCAPGGQKQGPSEPLTLIWWGTGKDEDYFARIIEQFEDSYENISVEYQEKNPAGYELELIDALAANQGPDIAIIHSDWFYKHKDKLSPLSLEPDQVESFKDVYLPVVSNLVLEDNRLYGIPLDVETLGLYFNRDLFNEQKINRPPADWSQFNEYVRKLTKKADGKIIQAGAAIGTANNISTAEDILLSMMLQNGTEIVSSDKLSAIFHTSTQSANNQPVYAGRKALGYYTAFADPNKLIYSWNSRQKAAWQMFADGRVAMFFDYYSRASDIYNRNPELDFEFARIPQIKGARQDEQKVVGKYWFHSVTNNTQNYQWAWRFIQFLARHMADSSLKEEAERYREDREREEIFVGQALIAETVYKGRDPERFDQAFKDMIDNVAQNKQDISNAIDTAAARITNIYRKDR